MIVKTIISYRTKAEMEQESVVDGNLATEASLIVLDTLEIIVKVNSMRKNGISHSPWLSFCVEFPCCIMIFHSVLCSDCGGVRAEGKCFRRGAPSASSQHGR